MKQEVFMLCALLSLFTSWDANAASLDFAISQAAQHYSLDPKVMYAIANIESTGGVNVKMHHNSNGTYDVGPFQINSVHWNTTCKGLDVSADRGNAMCAARLLSLAKRHAATDPHWIGRYHSKTPSRKLWYATKVRDNIKYKGAK